MALYVKDNEADRLVSQVAALRGLSKSAAVKRMACEELERLRATVPLAERIAAWRKANPMPPMTGPVADKQFYDWLSE